jgi:hypothetical protein
LIIYYNKGGKDFNDTPVIPTKFILWFSAKKIFLEHNRNIKYSLIGENMIWVEQKRNWKKFSKVQ